jgi:hypothetical protein
MDRVMFGLKGPRIAAISRMSAGDVRYHHDVPVRSIGVHDVDRVD